MLKITDLNTHYGPIHALKGVDMEIGKGEVVSLIGSNGAGKSTLLNTIVGIARSSGGRVEFMGKEITNSPPHTMTKLGISISPEGREVFPALTVEENLRLGAYTVNDKKKIADSYERVYQIFPRLKERIRQSAGTLSGGEQQMLAIGRALLCKPRMILLDEPSLGLAPIIIKEIFESIVRINKQGTSVLFVEQNSKIALNVADRGYVMQNGEIILHDTSVNLLQNEEVKKAYLGE